MSDLRTRGFAVVGQYEDNRSLKALQNQSGVKVTMGKGLPLQTEGGLGDITVREVPAVGQRVYIKTHMGWQDINLLSGLSSMVWKDLTLLNGWQSFHATTIPQYAMDTSGMVHLRGAIKGSVISANTIAAVNSGTSDYLEDSGNGFVTAGFVAGQEVTISGFTGDASNNQTGKVIASVTAGTMTFASDSPATLVNDAAGETVTVKTTASASNILFRMPEGFRPGVSHHQLTFSNDGSSVIGSLVSDGEVVKIVGTHNIPGGTASSSNHGNVHVINATSTDYRYIQLDSISFYVGYAPETPASAGSTGGGGVTHPAGMPTHDIGEGLVE